MKRRTPEEEPVAGGGRPAADPPGGTSDSATPQDGGNPNDNGDGHAAAHGNQSPRQHPQAVGEVGAKRREWEERHDAAHGAKADERIRDIRAERLIKGAVSTTSGSVTLGDHYRVTNSFFLTAPSAGDGPSDAPFGPNEVESLLCVRVATGSETELAWRLRTEDQIILLKGREDSGRRTAALCALAEVGVPTKDRPLRLAQPSTPLGTLADHVDGTACGYLLDASGTGTLREPSATDLAKLRSALREHDARLVVLVDEDDQPGPMQLRAVEHDPPDKRAVFERNLAWFLLPPEAVVPSRSDVDSAVAGRVARLLDQVGTVPSVQPWLASFESPADASTLAHLLSEETERGSAVLPDELDARVAEVRTAHLRSRARELLRSASSAHSPVDQAYVIAAAVLDGCTLATVIDAAEHLAELLQQKELPDGRWRRRTFARPLARRLRHVDTQQRGAGSDADGSMDTVVTLKQPPLRNIIVDVVWQEYEAARRPLWTWLVRLCEDSREEFPNDHPDVQIGVGLALARLAEHDFQEIVTNVLHPWARLISPFSKEDLDGSEWQKEAKRVWHCRTVVAWVMEQLVVGGAQRTRALNQLDAWMRDTYLPRRHTAVLAFGTRIARTAPERVFPEIRGAFQRLDIEFARADRASWRAGSGVLVAGALEGAFDAGMRHRALHLLTRPDFARGPAATLAAVQALLRIASLKERDRDDETAPRGPRPALLVWLDSPTLVPDDTPDPSDPVPDIEELTKGIARLWTIALAMRDDKNLNRTAWSVLHRWDTLARSPDTGTPGLRGRMNRVLDELRGTEPGLREEIEHYEKVRDHIAAHRRTGTGG